MAECEVSKEAQRSPTSMTPSQQVGENPQGQHSSTISPPPLGNPHINPSCIFCKICSRDSPAEIVYEDSEYVCFVDKKPVSTHHYLVVPRQHIQDSRVLTESHTPLVERMAEIGKQVLEERGGSLEEARLGFHWPPFIFVKHLHLHIISPESEMGWLNRKVVFRKDSYVFSSPTYMVDYLKTKS